MEGGIHILFIVIYKVILTSFQQMAVKCLGKRHLFDSQRADKVDKVTERKIILEDGGESGK